MRPEKAGERAPRDTREHVETCPFGRGNAACAPPENGRWPANGDWDVRIVPNLCPVPGDDRRQANLAFGLQQVSDGYGRHEVVV